jgi:hypothetical protein
MDYFTLIYALYGTAGIFLFWKLPAHYAVAIVYIGGLILLPVGQYRHVSPMVITPYWIIGTALPSDQLVNKSWISPCLALLGALLFDPKRLALFRPEWVDMPMLLWCLWPLAQSLVVAAHPQSGISALYLVGVWGVPWILGRCYFSGNYGRSGLIDIFIVGTVLLLPIAVFETFTTNRVYELVYGPHPFAQDGVIRYAGYRPLAFFEHGNVYGLWLCTAAVAAIWRTMNATQDDAKMPYRLLAALLIIMALAAQSVGAIALMLVGITAILLPLPSLPPRWVGLVVAALILCVAVTYVGGIVPVRDIALHNPLTQKFIALMRAAGRGSFTWRVSQDLKTLPLVQHHFLFGSGVWDWWRPAHTRPWGLPILIIGQFGLAGLLLAVTAPITAFFRHEPLRTEPILPLKHQARFPLAIILAMALADSLFNSFIFLPAIAIAGGLSAKSTVPGFLAGPAPI